MRKHLGLTIFAIIAIISACTSPLELDVDRDKTFIDGAVHPRRVSIYYHFADSAYESMITDPVVLESMWIERATGIGPQGNTDLYSVTIPELAFTVSNELRPSKERPVMVEAFSFSCERQPADGEFRFCVNPRSWIRGRYLEDREAFIPFMWMADDRGRHIRAAFTAEPEQRIVKGSIILGVTEPRGQRSATYRARITLEY